ncbi:MAG TPA: response regulator [Candidatus Sulfotelmatobacter sp.]|nr:response regulator [Candidatus Sulfotelmatobacter sp.]
MSKPAGHNRPHYANTPLNILIVEDNPNDAELVLSELQQAGFNPKWKRVETEPDFLAEIKKSPDIILSDYSMPQFSGLRAAKLLQESGLNIPFILISGTVGEEVAVNAIKHGANDYLLKDRISRLPNAVERALDQKRLLDERLQAEALLRESEEKFRQIAESINEVFWVTDPAKERVLYISPGYEKIWGQTCKSLYESPHNWLMAVHPEDRRRIIEAAMTKQELGEYDEIYRIVRPDGSVRWIHDRGFPVRNPAGEIYRIVGTAADITEQRKLEEQLRQSQKMEAIGQLASGVAHDFNNILAVIQMQSHLLEMVGNLSPEQKGFAAEIGEATQRAAALTRQLLLFSRKEKMQTRELDLDKSVNDMTKMLRRTLGENAELQFKFSMQPLFVLADAGMMDQVLMNLAVNARDAMPKGGKLVIETSAVEFDESIGQQCPQARAGSFACLSVSDTGTGIPPEILPRIFEPFFTTKDVGKGTGLGLATVFGIIQLHQGWISVYSQAGNGTTFRIYIPRLARISGQKFVASTTELPRGGNETILVVEDEPKLRASVINILSRLGYNVLEAFDGASAIEAWKKHKTQTLLAKQAWNQHRDGIHLLLADMVMPGGMTGKDLGEQLLKENPGLKVIYVSGYSAEVASKDFPLKEGVNFLSKPFQALKLAQTIRNILDNG